MPRPPAAVMEVPASRRRDWSAGGGWLRATRPDVLQTDDLAGLVNRHPALARLRVHQGTNRPAQHHNVRRPRFLHVEEQVGNVEGAPELALYQLDNRLNRQRERLPPRLTDAAARGRVVEQNRRQPIAGGDVAVNVAP